MRHSVVMYCAVHPARISRSPITLAVTGIAPGVRVARHIAGLRRARPICCRSSITTWSLLCRRRSVTLPITTSQRSTPSCSRPPLGTNYRIDKLDPIAIGIFVLLLGRFKTGLKNNNNGVIPYLAGMPDQAFLYFLST